MSTSATNSIHDNIHIGTSAVDAHLANIRSRLPPPIRSACLPDSASTLLRNLLLSSIVLNLCLVLTSPFASGARFMGSSILLISVASLFHAFVLVAVLGNYTGVADALGGSRGGVNFTRLANTIRGMSSRFGTDPYVHGALFGSTLLMATMMRVTSSYYGEVSNCIVVAAAAAGDAATKSHLTGGYANNNMSNHDNDNGGDVDNNNHQQIQYSATSMAIAACGTAVASAGIVSFLCGLLFWANATLAATLYVKRGELLSVGDGSSSSTSSSSFSNNGQYDEIGMGRPETGGGGGFAGDFPSSQGMTTMNV